METEEEAPRFPNAGKASLESMLESAVVDRFASQKQSKALTLGWDSQKSDYKAMLWVDRF